MAAWSAGFSTTSSCCASRAGSLQVWQMRASVKVWQRWQCCTEARICQTCSDPARDAQQLLVVENPADQAAMERSGSYRGLYFVLMGRLSPLDGIGLTEIGLHPLLDRAAGGAVREVILATGFSAEGEATAQVLSQALRQLKSGDGSLLQVTRLARGVPVGSELEYVDLSTLAHALSDRR